MNHDDLKLTSGAVILAGLLLASTDSRAAQNMEISTLACQIHRYYLTTNNLPENSIDFPNEKPTG